MNDEIPEPKKFLLRRGEVFQWLEQYGFSDRSVRSILDNNQIPKHPIPIGKGAFYHRETVKNFLREIKLI